MTPANIETMHSMQEYYAICSNESRHLLKAGIEQGRLPSRPQHILKLIPTIARQGSSIAIRIASMAMNLFQLCVVPFKSKHVKGEVAYRAIRLLIIDPLHLLNGITITALRVICTVIGVFSPLAAAKGWYFSAILDETTKKFKDKTYRHFVPNLTFEEYTNRDINPKLAKDYLGEDVCLKLKPIVTNLLPDQMDAWSNQLRTDLKEFLTFINRQPEALLQQHLNRDFDALVEKGDILLAGAKVIKRIKALKEQTEANQIDKPVEDIICENLATEEVINFIKDFNIFIVAGGQDGMLKKFAHTFHQVVEQKLSQYSNYWAKLDQSLSFLTKFGYVRVPKS